MPPILGNIIAIAGIVLLAALCSTPQGRRMHWFLLRQLQRMQQLRPCIERGQEADEGTGEKECQGTASSACPQLNLWR